MNREEFIHFMHHPELLDRSSVDEMREVVHEFPYFQSGHLLFLKNLYLLDNIRFPGQLKVSAAHITDREVLYHLLHKKRSETIPVQQENQPESTVSVMPHEPSGEEPIILIDENEEIIHHIAGETGPEDKDETTGTTSSPETLSGMVSGLLNFEYPRETERFSFAVWLDRFQEKSIHEEERIPSDATSRDKTKDELIDKFLASEPRIISAGEPEEEQEDISVQSITEDEGLISDTLARIYVKQGYYSKAIFTYEKLSLKFPEKSSYFASQIEKIQQLINKL